MNANLATATQKAGAARKAANELRKAHEALAEAVEAPGTKFAKGDLVHLRASGPRSWEIVEVDALEGSTTRYRVALVENLYTTCWVVEFNLEPATQDELPAIEDEGIEVETEELSEAQRVRNLRTALRRHEMALRAKTLAEGSLGSLNARIELLQARQQRALEAVKNAEARVRASEKHVQQARFA